MRARSSRLIFAGAAVIALPVSFYGGLALKEYFLSNKLDTVTNDAIPAPHGQAMRARIVQLAQERSSLLEQRHEIDAKIHDLRQKMSSDS
ncbi:MAG: hypothetical protein TREMPRED_004011 [Tremellales sp. Tagirdzhanova-0007]|nr:MAG: hypothetical protein TREMPRED_004011 [Tremellales sp. Tagirdzhanova-0007]